MLPRPSASGGDALPSASHLRKILDPLPERRFGILGVDVRLRTDEEEVGNFFAHAYRWFPPDDGGGRLDLAAILGPEAVPSPLVLAGERLVSLEGSPSPPNHAFLLLLGSIMDAIRGSLLVHGAAVSDGGKGVILAGPAFAGKSTLVLALMRRGCAFLSDDAAPIDRRTGRLLPFPRAVGVRKQPGGSPPAAGGTLDLPHRWLVDPEALGAKLPARPCSPEYLFYLDPGGWSTAAPAGEILYELSLAGEDGPLREDLAALGGEIVEEIPPRPFPGIAVRFDRREGLIQDLAAVQRRHRDRLLFLEERRPPVSRTPGPPAVHPVPVSDLLLPLVRDLLNRGEEGRLMKEHGGRVAPLLVELGSALRATKAYRVTSGAPEDLSALILDIVRNGEAS